MSDFITNAELRIEAERLCDENEQLRSEKAALERRIDELCAEVERLTNENVFLRYVAENLAMVANDLVCDDFDRDEMLEKANEDLRSLGIEAGK